MLLLVLMIACVRNLKQWDFNINMLEERWNRPWRGTLRLHLLFCCFFRLWAERWAPGQRFFWKNKNFENRSEKAHSFFFSAFFISWNLSLTRHSPSLQTVVFNVLKCYSHPTSRNSAAHSTDGWLQHAQLHVRVSEKVTTTLESSRNVIHKC